MDKYKATVQAARKLALLDRSDPINREIAKDFTLLANQRHGLPSGLIQLAEQKVRRGEL